jgi:hypothetical protein
MNIKMPFGGCKVSKRIKKLIAHIVISKIQMFNYHKIVK